MNKWIEETERVVMEHRLRHESMDYCIPINQDTKCSKCHTIVPRLAEPIHHLSAGGNVEILCSMECYMKT